MPDQDKQREKTNAMISAYDERTRLFGDLRNQKLEGDALDAAIVNYANASKTFDEAKAALIKK